MNLRLQLWRSRALSRQDRPEGPPKLAPRQNAGDTKSRRTPITVGPIRAEIGNDPRPGLAAHPIPSDRFPMGRCSQSCMCHTIARGKDTSVQTRCRWRAEFACSTRFPERIGQEHPTAALLDHAAVLDDPKGMLDRGRAPSSRFASWQHESGGLPSTLPVTLRVSPTSTDARRSQMPRRRWLPILPDPMSSETFDWAHNWGL